MIFRIEGSFSAVLNKLMGIDLAEVELPGETSSENVGKLAVIICPYCQSTFEDKRKIDKHMDT